MKRILAFEGDGGAAEWLREGFARFDCQLDIVDDEDEGVALALSTRPDLILLSIELPRTTGFSVCNRLKRNDELQGIPLIITSYECTEETFEAHSKMKTAAQGYLHTPCDFEELLALCKGLIDLDERPARDEAPEAPRPEGVIELLPASAPAAARSAAAQRERCMLVLWSPDRNLRGRCFGFGGTTEGTPVDEEGRHAVTFGRGEDNDVVIADQMVSSHHFRLEHTQDTIYVRDLGSGNGTSVNDELISIHELQGGEILQAGETSFIFMRDLDVDEQFEVVVRELTERDAVTRTLSYRRVRERLADEIEAARAEGTSLSLAAVSIDDLTQVTYRFGDAVAERLTVEIAGMLSKSRGAIVGRDLMAGFLAVLPGMAAKVAVGLAEGWRFEAGVSEIIVGNHSVSPTLSVGVLEWRDDWGPTDVLRRAYRLLWEAQQSGGNRVIARRASEPQGTPPPLPR